MIQKCYGDSCITKFLCLQCDSARELFYQCEFIKNNIDERLSSIPDISTITVERDDLVLDAIYKSFEEILDAIGHKYKESILDDVTAQIHEDEGYFHDIWMGN